MPCPPGGPGPHCLACKTTWYGPPHDGPDWIPDGKATPTVRALTSPATLQSMSEMGSAGSIHADYRVAMISAIVTSKVCSMKSRSSSEKARCRARWSAASSIAPASGGPSAGPCVQWRCLKRPRKPHYVTYVTAAIALRLVVALSNVVDVLKARPLGLVCLVQHGQVRDVQGVRGAVVAQANRRLGSRVESSPA